MGRKKKPPESAKSRTWNMKMPDAYHDWLRDLLAAAGDENLAELAGRLFAKEAKRLKLPPPPPR